MPPEHRRYTDDVDGVGRRALCFDLSDGLLHADRIPMGNGVEDEAKSTELFFCPCRNALRISPRSPW